MIDPSYPIGKDEGKKFNFASREQFISEIEHLPFELELALNGLSGEDFLKRYRPASWTITQLTHHLVDSHINAYIRLKLALTETNPTINPYDENQWAMFNDATNIDTIMISVSILKGIHNRWVQTLNQMSEEQYKRTYYHPSNKKTVTLGEMLISYAWHGNHHVAQIKQAKEKRD
jgi:uncharacterized damage-inducible protein DinB